ncbi:hypothetical protein [Bosea minatitlanensis]|uniref:Uncharacterized protein n=1 Tax=Bosea minatitlanensis TaxID=128782 RepID=A0ABW0F0E9_9HYPH|nr:hypothetical protein [Bosea minatitlanensis]MCT4491758.1 hypothetical protein [Bosea minatitlanensis]
MTRRKGEITPKHRNRSHPYQVALDRTPGPIAYGIMYRWAAWFDSETTPLGLHGMCWCFCRPEVADAFAMDFGGRRIDRPVESYYLKVDLPDARELERRAKTSRNDRVTGGLPADTASLFREAITIPFSSFSDPADVARAQGALDRAWMMVRDSVPETDIDRERLRLAYIVASFALIAVDEEDLARRAAERFRKGPRGG